MLHEPDVHTDAPGSADCKRIGAAQGGEAVHQFDPLGAYSACNEFAAPTAPRATCRYLQPSFSIPW